MAPADWPSSQSKGVIRKQCFNLGHCFDLDLELKSRRAYTTCRADGGAAASFARSPVHSCQRRTITSQYLGSSSTSRAWRPAFSQAIRVEPEPPNGSKHKVAGFARVADRPLDQGDRFHRRMEVVARRLVHEPDVLWSRAPHQ